MAATQNLSQFPQSHNLHVPRHGVVTLYGYGVRANVDKGHLVLDDGIGSDRRNFRLSRVNHGLKRLVIVGTDGCVSLAALRWLADQRAAFVMLERNGEVLCVTGPAAPSDARLRRLQALAHHSGIALAIARELIAAKLSGQENVARRDLNNTAIADLIAEFRKRLATADTVEAVRILEAHAAGAYWGAWRNVPVRFPKTDLPRVPDHWKSFGNRASPLTGSPRLAVTQAGAILNYCYALLESESRLALAALGLDPGLGMLHRDTPTRDSLACDVMEAVRADVDSWLLHWLLKEPLRRCDFFEQRNGNCRLMGPFASKLNETGPTWAKLVAPWAEYVAHTLWNGSSQSRGRGAISTRLTQQHRREAKGQPSFPKVETTGPDHLCAGCGKKIRKDATHCEQCNVVNTRQNFDAGRRVAHRPEFLTKRANTQRKHKRAIRSWKPSDLPAWLTRDVYVNQLQPALAKVTKAHVRSALGVSEPYASFIQTGKRIPHPRHWQILAGLVGLSCESV